MRASGSASRSQLRAFMLGLLLLSTATGILAAQSSTQPTLDEILRRTQDNLWEYRSGIPDFFADERVVSTMKQEGARDMKITTDSVFRLARSRTIGDEQTLNESREVRRVNNKPAKGDELRGPAIFTGAFSSAPGAVSLEMSRCFDYTLEPPAVLNKLPAILVTYTFKPDMLQDDGCPGPEKLSARAWLDPATFHLLRIETTIPNHVDTHGIHMLWTWSADFAPINLDGKTFWLPTTITSRSEANDGSAIWSFTATYTNYHRLTVKSRILTDPDEPPPPPR